jgi:formamidopyrimidine-DNA glycosylase
MPELPEAETIRRQLEAQILGRRITGAIVRCPRLVRAHRRPADFVRGVRGRRVTAVGRRGKAVVITLDKAATLVIRLGMSGCVVVGAPERPRDPHTHVTWQLDDGREARFRDPRQFGQCYVVQETDWERIPDLTGYGPEPLSDALTREYLTAGLARRSSPIKAVLMDQRFVAGIGNIYADEILFAARVHPARPARSLTAAEVTRLRRAIPQVLRRAVRHAGTSLPDAAYRDVYGEMGRFRRMLCVYQRTGQPCRTCGIPIERMVIGARSAHCCPDCQPSEGERP